jgi:uncharacterized protein (DUF1684 family)
MKQISGLKSVLLFSLLLLSGTTFCQAANSSYTDSINAFIKNYVATHEVVKGEDRKHLHFFPADAAYRVTATFEKINEPEGFQMATSRKSLQSYYRYGKISFEINGVPCQLTVYQSKDLLRVSAYKDHLFLPFTDASTGVESYEGGRYIDLTIPEITGNRVLIDFNKAYNPYCCYTEGFACPIPPKENALKIAIHAGEQKYTKPVH